MLAKKTFFALVAAFILFTASARAVQGGRESSDPNGLRRSVVGVIGPRGKCTGTVIARRMVVTAAHCLRDSGDYAIRLVGPDGQTQDAKVANLVIHPRYATPLRDGRYLGAPPRNDVALIIAATDFPDWIEPARLAKRLTHRDVYRDIALSSVAGMGPVGASDAERIFGTLRYLTFNDMRAGPKPSSNLLIRFREGSGVCIGDSGGPVYVSLNGSMILFGVMSSVNGPKGMVCGGNVLAASITAFRAFVEEEAAKAGQSIAFE